MDERPCILIIDDDPGLRKTLADILRAKGYETLAAGSGEEGLALLEESLVSLVLIDLGLPDIPGLEVLRRLKADHPAVEAIILTGQATLDTAIAATNSGAFSYMLKPYDLEQLLLQVRRAIEKQAAEEKIARHTAELQRTNAELKALYEVSRAISQTIDLEQLLAEVMQALAKIEIFSFEIKGAIFVVEDGNAHLASFLSPGETVVEPCREIRAGQCLCGQAVATGEVVVSRNPVEDGRHALCHPDTAPHGRVAIPLKAAHQVVGLLTLYTQPGTTVNDGQLSLLSALGNQIGVAISNARLYEETRNSSLRDPLTGLSNRRFLEMQMEKCLDAAQRYGGELSVIMLDIDHFKRYNDTHGHPEGDRLLATLGGILVREVRRADSVFRYGGEEFLILLPATGPAMALEAAERVRRAVEAEGGGVTVSLGVASLSGAAPDKDALIGQADRALYQAKQNGRNRVEMGGTSTPSPRACLPTPPPPEP